ncbi:MAG: hypothetical protein HY904_07285 [Deltaproteobacteria bacterium]|nr:hypothetical protein [Deltaproteobacteria bacterium]
MRAPMTLGILAWSVCGCVRVVVGGPGAGPHIDEVAVEPQREAPQGAGSLTCGFSGDVLVVRGSGWDPATVQVRIGGTELVRVSADEGEVRGAVPLQAVEGDITVLAGDRASAPAAQRFCHLGPGHLPAPAFQGVVEPRVTILASGPGGMPCPPTPSTGTGAGTCATTDGGVDPHCTLLEGERHAVSVSFALGSTFSVTDPLFVARVYPEVGASQVSEVARLSAGERVRIPHATASHGEPFAPQLFMPSFHDDPAGVVVQEEVVHEQGFSSRILVGGAPVFSRGSQDNAFIMPQLMLTDAYGVALVASVDATVGRAVTAQLLQLDGTLLEEVDLSGRVLVAASLVSARWLGQSRGAAVVAITRDAGLTPSTLYLDILTRNDTGAAQIVHGVPLTEDSCDSPLLPAGAAAGCHTCVRASLERAGAANAVPQELAPLAPFLFLAAPMRPLTPLQETSEALCGVGIVPQPILGRLPWAMQLLASDQEVRVAAVAVLPECSAEAARIALVPSIAGQRPRQLWLVENNSVSIHPTRTVYAQVHADPVVPVFYAIPSSGGRVDMVDQTGALARSAHVLGTPALALPYPSDADGLLVAWPALLGRMDATGNIVQHASMDLPLGVAAEQDAGGNLVGVWRPERTGGSASPNAMTLVGTAPGDGFGQPVRSVAMPAVAFAAPLTRVGQWLVSLAWRQGSPAGPAGCDPVLVAVDVESSTGTADLGCNAVGAMAETAQPTLYGVFRASGVELTSLPYRLDAFDMTAAQPTALPLPYFPANVAPHPAGGVVGVFVDPASFSLRMGHLSVAFAAVPPDTYREFTTQPAPFIDPPLAVSPDGRRLYAGLEDLVMTFELVHDDTGALADARVLGQVPVRGVPAALAMDPSGSRLVYLAPETQEVGLVR